ncbi:MAG TPA: hypothetical protein VGF34_08820 [Stellaceae bacterium]
MLAVVADSDAQAPSSSGSSPRSVGTWFHLISIATAAAATVSVFFGIGFPLLLQEAGGVRADAQAATPALPRSAPVAEVAAAFVRLPPPLAASMKTDNPRPSLPEHAAIDAAGPAPEIAPPPARTMLPPTAPLPSEAAPTKSAITALPQPVESAPAPSNAPMRAGAPLPAAEVAALLDRGDQFLRAGDVASARLFYERAADAGDGQAALREAATFDPAFLANAGLRGTLADPAKAHWWYARAHQAEPGKEAR